MRHFCTGGRDAVTFCGEGIVNRQTSYHQPVHRKPPEMGFTKPRFGRSVAAFLLTAFLGTSGTATGAGAQGITIANYGDWELQCDTPPGAQYEQCALRQWVVAADRANVGLVVYILKTADQSAQLMTILAPLGVLLPARLELLIDDVPIGWADFIRCLQEGCYAEVLLEEELLAQLTAGQTASFVVYTTPEEGIVIPITLVGLGEGFAALP